MNLVLLLGWKERAVGTFPKSLLQGCLPYTIKTKSYEAVIPESILENLLAIPEDVMTSLKVSCWSIFHKENSSLGKKHCRGRSKKERSVIFSQITDPHIASLLLRTRLVFC